jgi:hypothetical protein
MRKFLNILFVSFLMLTQSEYVQAASGFTVANEASDKSKPTQLTYAPKLSALEVENFLGRKMTFMERVGFKVNKKKFVKTTNEARAMAGNDRTNTMAIVGFVTSLILPPLGIIFGLIALSQIRRSREKGHGLAIAGLIIGIVFTAVALLVIL